MITARNSLALACVFLVTVPDGCSRVVEGSAGAAAGFGVSTVALPQLLIDPAQFPPEYPAVVLDPTSADVALRNIDGMPDGSTVTPAQCVPPAPGPAAAVTGTGVDGTMAVAVTRVAAPLGVRLDQLMGCPSFAVDAGGAESSVNVTVLAPPPVGVDSYAVEQTTSGATSFTRLTLAAQLQNVRVIASTTASPGQQPDTVTLDGLFSDAVLKARRGGRS